MALFGGQQQQMQQMYGGNDRQRTTREQYQNGPNPLGLDMSMTEAQWAQRDNTGLSRNSGGGPSMQQGGNAGYGSAFGASNVNTQGLSALQSQTEQEGRRIRMDEWQGIGGTPETYRNLYAGTVDEPYIQQLQAQAQAGNRQVTPQEWMSAGGSYQDYHSRFGGAPLSASPFASSPIPSGAIPNPVDPMSAITGQQSLNAWNMQQQQNLNRINESGPFGSATYRRNPDGTTTRDYQLSGNQNALNQQIEGRDLSLGNIGQGSINQIGNNYSSPFSFDGLPKAPGSEGFQEGAQAARDAVYSSFERRNEPVFQREKEEFQQRMADQGVPQGSSLYNRLEKEMDQRQNDARLNAQTQAYLAGSEEHSRMFGLQGEARDRATGEYSFSRNAPANELATLLQMQRGVQNPQFQSTSNINIPTYNVADIGLGYLGEDRNNRSLAQQLEIARMQDATNRYGIEKGDPLALARLRGEIDIEKIITDHELDQTSAEGELTNPGTGAGTGTRIYNPNTGQWEVR